MAKAKKPAAKPVKAKASPKVDTKASKATAKAKAPAVAPKKAKVAKPAVPEKSLASKVVGKVAQKVSSLVQSVTASKAEPAAKVVKPEKSKKEISTAEPKSILKSQPAEAPAKKATKTEKKAAAAEPAVNLSKDEVNPQWYDFYRKNSHVKAAPYDMRAQFEANQPLMHKVLGWGWVVSNENDRLEVIFKDGKRMLISNYKPS